MALVKQYQTFRARLGGYTEVGFEEFRGQLVPLRRKREAWGPEETEYVRGLADRGAGYALQQFFGERHPAAAGVLGGAVLAPDPLTRQELIDHLRALVRSCLAVGWTPERFEAFARYLDSDMTPAQLVEQHREARRQRALQASLFQAAKAPAFDDWDDGEAPEEDRFAAMYRAASSAFRRCTLEQFATAAARARAARAGAESD